MQTSEGSPSFRETISQKWEINCNQRLQEQAIKLNPTYFMKVTLLKGLSVSVLSN
jgi:hypothetical protein